MKKQPSPNRALLPLSPGSRPAESFAFQQSKRVGGEIATRTRHTVLGGSAPPPTLPLAGAFSWCLLSWGTGLTVSLLVWLSAHTPNERGPVSVSKKSGQACVACPERGLTSSYRQRWQRPASKVVEPHADCLPDLFQEKGSGFG